jgi:hypothetical protein
VNFKRAVWHESFRVLLSSIATYSLTGCWVQCGDKIQRHLFPFIFILSGDYEEQYAFLLIVILAKNVNLYLDLSWH